MIHKSRGLLDDVTIELSYVSASTRSMRTITYKLVKVPWVPFTHKNTSGYVRSCDKLKLFNFQYHNAYGH